MGAARGDDPPGRLIAGRRDFGARVDAATRVTKRSVVVAGHRTSVSLEDAFWSGLGAIAARDGKSINAMIGEIDRGRAGNLSSAIRVFVLRRLTE